MATTRKPKKPAALKTAAEVAKELGIDRTTLVRMHGRKDIPECKNWGMKPQPHRLYDEDEFKAIKDFVKQSQARKVPVGVTIIINKEDVNNEQP